MTGGEPLFDEKVVPALKRAFRVAKKHGFPFVATFQVTEEEAETATEALLSSFRHLPEGCTSTLTNGLLALCPEYEQVMAEKEKH